VDAFVYRQTRRGKTIFRLTYSLSVVYGWSLRCHFDGRNLEGFMQLAITSLAVITGLVFSIAIAILVEEFIFGEVFRLFLAPQAVERVRARSMRR
jgi:hypothetical protein